MNSSARVSGVGPELGYARARCSADAVLLCRRVIAASSSWEPGRAPGIDAFDNVHTGYTRSPPPGLLDFFKELSQLFER